MGFLGTHRTWEDWFGIILGSMIVLSPWLTGQIDHTAAFWTSTIVGAAVLVLAGLQLVSLQLWEEGAEIFCGLCLIAAPLNFGYAGALGSWHFVLGAIVILLAVFELWQDWTLSEDELARHGQ